MLRQHCDEGADVTVGCLEVPRMEATGFGVMAVDENDRIVSFLEKPKDPPGIPGNPDMALASMGIYVFETAFLVDQLNRDAADPNSSRDFGKDIIPHLVKNGKAVAHRFARSCVRADKEAEAYWRDVGTIDAYWEANIDLAHPLPSLDLYDSEWPIWTYGEITPPAKFVHNDDHRRGLAVNSLVSGGCIISGAAVNRSLLFTGVRVNSYASVDNCVILPRVDVGRSARLSNVVDRPGRRHSHGARHRGGSRARRQALSPHRAGHLPGDAADDRPARTVTPPRTRCRFSPSRPRCFRSSRRAGWRMWSARCPRRSSARASRWPRCCRAIPRCYGISTARRPCSTRPISLAAAEESCAERRAAPSFSCSTRRISMTERAGHIRTRKGRTGRTTAQRFAALGRMAAAIGQGAVAGFSPDIVHAHDWQAGLTPAYLHYAGGRRPGTVMTVHNLAFQGVFPSELFPTLGLPGAAFAIDGVEYYGSVGFLKAGLQLADRITTVSPTYAQEIAAPGGGMGLDGLLQARSGVLSGILNGIDETVWDPSADTHLASRFSTGRIEARGPNKRALQERMGLAPDEDALLFGVISRLSWQKGLDLLLVAIPELLSRGAQLVVLGSGDAEMEHGFRKAAEASPGQAAARIGYDEGLAHLIQGGVDALLVPSRFEPCGLTQLCAMRYGALPVVARVGGLNDTVIDANEVARAAGVATGFQFSPVTLEALNAMIDRVAKAWADKPAWRKMQVNAMRADVGWSGPAARYAALYRSIVDGRRAG